LQKGPKLVPWTITSPAIEGPEESSTLGSSGGTISLSHSGLPLAMSSATTWRSGVATITMRP
jgi:hypothetical protein